MKNRKDVEVKVDDQVVNIYVTLPTPYVISRADRYKAKAWTECIDDGIKTREELAIIMEKRGVWTEHQKTKEKGIAEKINEFEKLLYIGSKDNKKGSIEDGVKTAIEMRKLRAELVELYMEKHQLEQNTAEAIADDARFDFLVAYCTFYENGNRVYNSIDDYNEKSADEIAFAAASALSELMYAYNPDREKSLPENQWLEHFGLLNEDLSLINEEKELVDTNGRKINKFGHYINDSGERVDIDGNPLDDKGNYVIQVEYDLNKKKSSPKTTKQTKKTTIDSK